MIKKGDKVFYNGKEIEIIHTYGNGYCEIRELQGKKIDLVLESQLLLIKN